MIIMGKKKQQINVQNGRGYFHLYWNGIVYVRAIGLMSTEEKRLTTMITDAFTACALRIHAFWITGQYASFKVFFQPFGIGQR